MQIIIDAKTQIDYSVGKPSDFYGGTELMIHKIAQGLSKNHIVHVVTPDLESAEHRAPTLFYWPPEGHPTRADVVVLVHSLSFIEPYSADLLILMSNGMGSYLGPQDQFANGIDAVACFSQCHKNLLTSRHPGIDSDKCFITGLGVDLKDYDSPRPADIEDHSWRQAKKVPGRFLYANAPERGLLDTLKIFQLVQKELPETSLHITYDWKRVLNKYRYAANAIAQSLWECSDLIESIPNITDLGGVSRQEVIREQLECQIHFYPSNPPNIGSQIHGITQMECAAAGCALVLSDVEAFPEVFLDGAKIIPVPGTYLPDIERRCTVNDWANYTIDLLRDPEAMYNLSRAARTLAERNTWDCVVENWENMLSTISGVVSANS